MLPHSGLSLVDCRHRSFQPGSIFLPNLNLSCYSLGIPLLQFKFAPGIAGLVFPARATTRAVIEADCFEFSFIFCEVLSCMCPTVRSTASEAFEVGDSSSPSPWKWFLLAILWIVAALFLLATTGGQAQSIAFNGQQTTVPAGSLHSPFGVAADVAGNIYVADEGNNRGVKVTPGGTLTILPVTSTSPPAAVAGDAYVAFYGAGKVLERRRITRPRLPLQ